MNALTEKYKNSCKLCFKEILEEPLKLGVDKLENLNLIKQLMDAEIIEENANYAKVINNAVCFKCASNLIEFINFRSSCHEKFAAFKKEFEQAAVAKTFVCEFCYNFFPNEDKLNVHKRDCSPSTACDMDIDESCDRLPVELPVEEPPAMNNNFKGYECVDCNRKFLPEEHATYLTHCRNVHPKKVPCPFGCVVTRADDKPGKEKSKRFRNLHFLALHMHKNHQDVMMRKTKIETNEP